MEYIWKIAQLERTAETGAVVTAHWRVTAQDGDYTASAYGSETFTSPDPESENFVPFEDLTEADVLGWVWNKEGFGKEQIEANLAAQIETEKNPPVVPGLPWA